MVKGDELGNIVDQIQSQLVISHSDSVESFVARQFFYTLQILN